MPEWVRDALTTVVSGSSLGALTFVGTQFRRNRRAGIKRDAVVRELARENRRTREELEHVRHELRELRLLVFQRFGGGSP